MTVRKMNFSLNFRLIKIVIFMLLKINSFLKLTILLFITHLTYRIPAYQEIFCRTLLPLNGIIQLSK